MPGVGRQRSAGMIAGKACRSAQYGRIYSLDYSINSVLSALGWAGGLLFGRLRGGPIQVSLAIPGGREQLARLIAGLLLFLGHPSPGFHYMIIAFWSGKSPSTIT